MSARPVNPKGVQFAIKYAADRLVAAVALLLALPLMVPAAARDPVHARTADLLPSGPCRP